MKRKKATQTPKYHPPLCVPRGQAAEAILCKSVIGVATSSAVFHKYRRCQGLFICVGLKRRPFSFCRLIYQFFLKPLKRQRNPKLLSTCDTTVNFFFYSFTWLLVIYKATPANRAQSPWEEEEEEEKDEVIWRRTGATSLQEVTSGRSRSEPRLCQCPEGKAEEEKMWWARRSEGNSAAIVPSADYRVMWSLMPSENMWLL